MKPRLKEKYDSELAAQLKDQLGLDNVMQVPRLQRSSSTWASATPRRTAS